MSETGRMIQELGIEPSLADSLWQLGNVEAICRAQKNIATTAGTSISSPGKENFINMGWD